MATHAASVVVIFLGVIFVNPTHGLAAHSCIRRRRGGIVRGPAVVVSDPAVVRGSIGTVAVRPSVEIGDDPAAGITDDPPAAIEIGRRLRSCGTDSEENDHQTHHEEA